jgi:hypothetical protein
LAPALFRGYHEFPVGLLACALLTGAALSRGPASPERGATKWRFFWYACAVLLAVFTVVQVRDTAGRSRRMERNFYGVLRVTETPPVKGYAPMRSLIHGTIIHGRQFVDPDRHMEPTAYYSPGSGVGLAFRLQKAEGARRLGVIGLGAGMLTVFTTPGDTLRFYEINPLVTALARDEFTFLARSPARLDVVHGDARLTLAEEAPQGFDVLAVDAFSGDSIPVHLLTLEAFALYGRHLKEDGVLAVHVTNKYLDLLPAVGRLAAASGGTAWLVETDDDPSKGYFGSTWVLIGNGCPLFSDPAFRAAARPLPDPGNAPLWTDDYSNLLGALK